MFMGNYTHSIDEKGRVAIPSEWRGSGEVTNEKWVVTQGFDNCLLLYTDFEWQNFLEKVKQLPYAHQKNRIIMRKTVAPARYVNTDKQGRVLIPQNLREYAGIEKEVILAGMITRIEVWNKIKWEELQERNKTLPEEDLLHLDF
jgi:MraZ protein